MNQSSKIIKELIEAKQQLQIEINELRASVALERERVDKAKKLIEAAAEFTGSLMMKRKNFKYVNDEDYF